MSLIPHKQRRIYYALLGPVHEGITFDQIAEQSGVNRGSLSRYMKEFGLLEIWRKAKKEREERES